MKKIKEFLGQKQTDRHFRKAGEGKLPSPPFHPTSSPEKQPAGAAACVDPASGLYMETCIKIASSMIPA